ncbi:MAG: tetratricopeptide repeat protein [Lachnospiraceae bacterium]|nr:tetratricopeptide repeat protein [Lachnospiraceae bacterium]
MYEKELEKAQERLNAALTLSKQHPSEAINMILDMEKWVDENIDNETTEYYGVIIAYNEAMGDLSLRMKKYPEAEGFYKKMARMASKLYETDKSKYDFRLATAYCKLANNCATNIGCQGVPQTPRVLNEKMQRPFDAGENFYKMAISLLQENCKKGSIRHLEIQARAINSLATMEAAVGKYKEALKMFDDSVRILKAIYQTVDNKESGAFLGITLQNQATVATLFKDAPKAQECLEDSIFVLKEHEEEDSIRAGVMIARNYMNLGGCMLFQKADLAEVDAVYDKATAKISMVNAIAKGAAIPDEVSCYMLAGQYYLKTEREEKGKEMLMHAKDLAEKGLEADPNNAQFKNMVKHIDSLFSEEEKA